MSSHLHRIAAALALAAGSSGMAIVFLAGPADASYPRDPGRATGLTLWERAPAPVAKADHSVHLGQVGAGVIGGVVVALAASAALNQRHHSGEMPRDHPRTT